LKLSASEKPELIEDRYFFFDGVFGQLIFEAREGDVGGVKFGSWKVTNGGLGGKPSAISLGKLIKRKSENRHYSQILTLPVY
jgi:hypothetical protein